MSNLFAFGSESHEIKEQEAAPETAEIYFLLGQCYTEQSKHNEALHAYSYSIKVCDINLIHMLFSLHLFIRFQSFSFFMIGVIGFF